MALHNASHLSEKDKACLLEYPLHRVGSNFPSILQSSVFTESLAEGPSTLTDSNTIEDYSTHKTSVDIIDKDFEQKPTKRFKLMDRDEIENSTGGTEEGGAVGDSGEVVDVSGVIRDAGNKEVSVFHNKTM